MTEIKHTNKRSVTLAQLRAEIRAWRCLVDEIANNTATAGPDPRWKLEMVNARARAALASTTTIALEGKP